ncbi:MAG: hypothetical protein LLG02_00490 [Pelosinus sp.]|nr:hypothetical protein [Pelosinus sp.]
MNLEFNLEAIIELLPYGVKDKLLSIEPEQFRIKSYCILKSAIKKSLSIYPDIKFYNQIFKNRKYCSVNDDIHIAILLLLADYNKPIIQKIIAQQSPGRPDRNIKAQDFAVCILESAEKIIVKYFKNGDSGNVLIRIPTCRVCY